MSRIHSKGTLPERIIRSELRRIGARFSQNVSGYPGKPDLLFPKERVAVFIDGDFWHGWRLPLWEHKLSKTWKDKIRATRSRDQQNFKLLRRMGWKVVRVWEHEVERGVDRCLRRILTALGR